MPSALSRTVRLLITILLAASAAYWLFADTVQHYFPQRLDPNEIRFSYWGGFVDHQMWQEIITAFESSHPKISVKSEWLPLAGYGTKLDHQFVAEAAPDVILFQDEPFPRYAPTQFANLEPLLAGDQTTRRRLADCWPTAVTSFQIEDALYGIPASGGGVLIYCNLDAFDRAAAYQGHPLPLPSQDWTLSDFIHLSQQLTFDADGDGRTDQFAFLLPYWVYYLPFIWAQGARLLDDTKTHWVLTGPAAEAAFQLYADLRFRFRVSPSPIEYAGQNSDTAFLSGRVAMCVNGPWFQPFLNRTALRDRYRVVPIPAGPGGNATRVTWDGLCMNATISPQRRANAWKFMRFILTRQAQTIFAAYQRSIPARRACAADYIRLGGGPESPAAAFITAMKTARLQPITPSWQIMSRAVRNAMTSVLLDGSARQTPQAALRRLASDPNILRSFGVTP